MNMTEQHTVVMSVQYNSQLIGYMVQAYTVHGSVAIVVKQHVKDIICDSVATVREVACGENDR